MSRKIAASARQRGVTLIELLIALVIVGILTAVALPSYQRYQERSYAAQAMADLGVCALALERHYTLNYTYTGAAASGGSPSGALCPAASPPRGTKLYDITISSANNNSYTLRAQPVAGGAAADAPTLELDAAGVKWQDINRNGARDSGEDNWEL